MSKSSEYPRTLYIAGPLFSLAERGYIESLAAELGKLLPGCRFKLPHLYAASIADRPDFNERVFAWCLAEARTSDAVVAILDGADADSGTCVEMGAVYGSVPIVGVRTDFRASEDRGLNLMVSKVCTELILLPATGVTVQQVAARIAEAVGRLRPR